ncbi:MAG: hypothetical protein NVS1B13_24210 [Flavisolibacter sp.]
MISRKRIIEHQNLYRTYAIPISYFERITYIANAIMIPKDVRPQKTSNPLTVVFVGRGGVEKRVHLIAKMANLLKQESSIKFEIAGDVSSVLRIEDYPFIKFWGNQKESSFFDHLYSRASVVLLTSSTEGFPMVVIEGMAYGCCIIATPVGDIPLHIHNNENGFLFSSVNDENLIVAEGVQFLSEISKNDSLRETIAKNNIEQARALFGIEEFNNAYRKLLGQSK